jgi:hypothetical protein
MVRGSTGHTHSSPESDTAGSTFMMPQPDTSESRASASPINIDLDEILCACGIQLAESQRDAVQAAVANAIRLRHSCRPWHLRFLDELGRSGGELTKACGAGRVSLAKALADRNENPAFRALWDESLEAGRRGKRRGEALPPRRASAVKPNDLRRLSQRSNYITSCQTSPIP